MLPLIFYNWKFETIAIEYKEGDPQFKTVPKLDSYTWDTDWPESFNYTEMLSEHFGLLEDLIFALFFPYQENNRMIDILTEDYSKLTRLSGSASMREVSDNFYRALEVLKKENL